MIDHDLAHRADAIRSRLINFGTVFDFEHKCLRSPPSIADGGRHLEQPRTRPGHRGPEESALVVHPKDALAAADDLGGLLQILAEDDSVRDEIQAEIQRLEHWWMNWSRKPCWMARTPKALLSVHARDGGVDANDWADMLLQMYIHWAKQHDYEVELLDRQDNEEAGITQATIAVRGPMAYGYLKGEEGIHRLVRISPFNAEGKRQTSFAAVDVSPEVSDSVAVEIDEKDVREDTYRASGAGGQHVNKTDSAVRLTHLPTGVVAQCQSERSQHKNRAMAWKMLRARLARIEEERREEEQLAKYKNKVRQKGFGSQIRNYFLHPEQRVKDARTELLRNNFQSVLNGDIQDFLDAYLRWRMAQNSPA